MSERSVAPRVAVNVGRALLVTGLLAASAGEANAQTTSSPDSSSSAHTWVMPKEYQMTSVGLLTAPSCQFVLGFKTLHDAVPQIVGDCVDNQAFASNGDAIQHTTNGMMVWRKADNWTAFTNGYETEINGPNGVQKRLNTQRFSWESNPEQLPYADIRPGIGGGAPAPISEPAKSPNSEVILPIPESIAHVVSWPAETARILTMLPTPDGLRLVSATSAPQDEPGCSGSCYRHQNRAVWYVGTPTSKEKGILAHEVGHSHQDWQIQQAGIPYSTENWAKTHHGQEFIAAFDAFRAHMSAQGKSLPFDNGYYENFAIFMSDWYDPVNTWAPIVMNDPTLKAFGEKWHPRIPISQQTRPA